jgi:hypothetical protein
MRHLGKKIESHLVLTVLVGFWGVRAGSSEICPAPEDLLAGVSVLCGEDLIVGTGQREGAPLCGQDGQTGCVSTEKFTSIARDDVTASAIRQGVQIGGVGGTFKQEIDSQRVFSCAADGQSECYVTGSLAALRLSGFEQKVLAGELVAGVSGTAVAGNLQSCSTLGETGCLSVGDWPAIEASRLESCLSGGAP